MRQLRFPWTKCVSRYEATQALSFLVLSPSAFLCNFFSITDLGMHGQINFACKKGVSRPTEKHISTYTQSLNHLLELPRGLLHSLHRSPSVSWTRPSFTQEKDAIKKFLLEHVAGTWEEAVATRTYNGLVRRRTARSANPSFQMGIKYGQMLDRVWPKLQDIADLHFEPDLQQDQEEEDASPGEAPLTGEIRDLARQSGCMDFVVDIEPLDM